MAREAGASRERVNIRYSLAGSESGEEVELPFRMIFLGDYTLRADDTPVGERPVVDIDKDSFDAVMKSFGLSLDIAATGEAGGPAGTLRFEAIADFNPAAVARQTPDITSLLELRAALVALKAARADEGADEMALAELVAQAAHAGVGDSATIDRMIAEFDRRISDRIDAIINDRRFRALETAWRSLKFVVDRTDFRQNIRIGMMSVSKEALLTDFEDSPEVTKSGLYKQIQASGHMRGEPVAAVVCDYGFGPGSRDVKLAQYCASVGSMSHAPFIAGASPAMFGVDGFAEIPGLKDMAAIFQGSAYAKWNALRRSDDARYLALALPRFLLRMPHGEGGAGGGMESHLWGNAAHVLATRLIESFTETGWRLDPVRRASYEAADRGIEPSARPGDPLVTDVLISDSKERALAEQGFVALAMRRPGEHASFFSAGCVRKPKGKPAELPEKLAGQLPFTMMVDRLAHYVKVLQRQNAARWTNRTDVETELNNWVRQYVSARDEASAEARARRPLRRAQITVSDVTGEPGWFGFDVAVEPHFKYMGADFTLSLKGKLEKA
jgi:type VI secretion system protein ImpC